MEALLCLYVMNLYWRTLERRSHQKLMIKSEYSGGVGTKVEKMVNIS